jgi:hypothetical protein
MSKNTPIHGSNRPIVDRGTGRGAQRFALRLARIVRVDYERYVCDVEYIEGSAQFAREIPLTSAYWSPRGFLGAVPTEGCLVVLGFNASNHHSAVRPFILAFLGNGIRTGLNFAPFGGSAQRNDPSLADATLDELTRDLEGLYGPTRHKLRKLTPGDIYGTSDKGAELLLDENAFMSDRSDQSITLDGIKEELRVIFNSLEHYGAGIYSRSGKIERSELSLPPDLVPENRVPQDDPRFGGLLSRGLITEAGEKTPLTLAQPVPRALKDNSAQIYIQEPPVLNQEPEDIFLPYLTEARKEIDLYSPFGTPDPVSRANREQEPFIEVVHGTVVGNNPSSLEGQRLYGKILKPVIFNSPYDTNGQPRLEAIDNNPYSENDYSGSASFLYRMRRPDNQGELFVAHDREGHVFLSIPASGSKSNNLGAGRSLEADLKGSAKITLGASKTDRTSLSLDAQGGVRMTAGPASPTGRAIDLTARGGVFIQATGTDAQGISYSLNTVGDVSNNISGALYEEVSGKVFRSSAGDMTASAEKLIFSSGGGGEDHTSTGAQRNIIALAQDNQIGKGRNTVIAAPLNSSSVAESLQITLGDRETSFIAPSSDTISFASTGEHTIEAAASLDVTVQSGGAMTYSIQAPTGTFGVSLTLINLNAPIVRVGGPTAVLPLALAPSLDLTLPTLEAAVDALQVWAASVATATSIAYTPVLVAPYTSAAATRAFGI